MSWSRHPGTRVLILCIGFGPPHSQPRGCENVSGEEFLERWESGYYEAPDGYYASATPHPPTGRVALEDFVRLLIGDFTVPPAREDWEQALEESRREFELDGSW